MFVVERRLADFYGISSLYDHLWVSDTVALFQIKQRLVDIYKHNQNTSDYCSSFLLRLLY